MYMLYIYKQSFIDCVILKRLIYKDIHIVYIVTKEKTVHMHVFITKI